MTTIAIIGAGMAGLTAANMLKEHAEVTVFEKSKGYGGRVATRYAKPYQFDHGAQYIKAKSKAFQAFLAPMIAAGVVRRWDAHFVEIKNRQVTQQRDWVARFTPYVGVHEMHDIGDFWPDGTDVRRQSRAQKL